MHVPPPLLRLHLSKHNTAQLHTLAPWLLSLKASFPIVVVCKHKVR